MKKILILASILIAIVLSSGIVVAGGAEGPEPFPLGAGGDDPSGPWANIIVGLEIPDWMLDAISNGENPN